MLIGATNVIPYFGPIIGAIPAVFIAFTISVKSVIIVLITVAVLQFLESNVLSPIIVGRSLHMHPVVIMLVLLAGGELFGLIGMILAVPSAYHYEGHYCAIYSHETKRSLTRRAELSIIISIHTY